MTTSKIAALTLAALMALTALTASAGCTSEDDDEDTRQACVERRLADGTGIGYDPGGAIAVSRGIEVSHPELSGIVDAVAERQAARDDDDRPDLDDMDEFLDEVGDDTAVVYLLVLTNLAADPELATPDVVAGFERAAADQGMEGVYGLATDASRYPAGEHGGQALTDLRLLVADQAAARREAGIEPVPTPGCRSS